MSIESVLVFTLLNCSNTIIKNDSSEEFNKHDQKVLNSTKARCSHYYPESPCVKLFWKTKPRSYRVICGAKK
jgi:hypothetical protein